MLYSNYSRKELHFCIPSHDRVKTAKTLKVLEDLNLLKYTYIFVYNYDYQLYKSVYKEATVIPCGVERSLGHKRNCIIEYAKQNNFKTIMMLDDDITNFSIKDKTNNTTQTTDFELIYKTLYEIMYELKFIPTALTTRYNFIATKDISNPNKILYDFSMPSNVLFLNVNECLNNSYDNLYLEDLDFFIFNIIKHKLIYKVNFIQVNTRIGENLGGYNCYVDLDKRFEEGYNQICKKYKGSNIFHKFNANKTTNFDGRKFKQWLLENEYYTLTELKHLDFLRKENSKKIYDIM